MLVQEEIEQTDVSGVPPYKLFSLAGVVIAAIFGSVLAGGIFMAINYDRLGKPKEAARTYWITFLVSVVALVIGIVLPQNVDPMVLSIPLLLGVWQAMKGYQLPLVNHHLAQQGKMESNWKAFGLSLLIGAVTFFMVCFAIAVFTPL